MDIDSLIIRLTDVLTLNLYDICNQFNSIIDEIHISYFFIHFDGARKHGSRLGAQLYRSGDSCKKRA